MSSSVIAQGEQQEKEDSFIHKHPVITVVAASSFLVLVGALTTYFFVAKNHGNSVEKRLGSVNVVQLQTREQRGDQSDGLSAAYDLLCLMHNDEEETKKLLADETGVFWDIKRVCDEASKTLPKSSVRILLDPALRSLVGLDRFAKEVELACMSDVTIIDDQGDSPMPGSVAWNGELPPSAKTFWKDGQRKYFLVRYHNQWTPFKFEKGLTGVRVTTTDAMGKDQTSHPAIEKIYTFLMNS